jgi:hypothetical protein
MPLKLAILAVLAAAALVPAAARAGTNAGSETVTAGPVSATLAWDAGEEGPKNARLSISRAGSAVFNRAIPKVCGLTCSRYIGDSDYFELVDLDGDGDPEAVVIAFPGQCCDQTMGVYGFDAATGGYTELTQPMGDATLEIKDTDGDGANEILTRDRRFANLVPGHTSLFFPPVVYAYEHAGGAPRLVDRTRTSLNVVRAAAAELKGIIDILDKTDIGVYAKMWVGSYVADEFLLGRGSVGLRELDRQARRGMFGTARSTRKYRKRLLTLLHQYGYR